MAGYLGSKPVVLTTTAADVNGTVTADGLTVDGTGVVGTFSSSNNNTVLRVKGNGATNGGAIGSTSSDDLVLLSGLTEKMRIDSSGNVGIGTDSPATVLELAASTNANKITFDPTNGGSNGDILGGFVVENDGAVGQIAIRRESSTTNSYISFESRPTGGVLTEAMRIDSGGNLLVGKTSQSVDTVGGEILSSGIGQFTVDGNFAGRFTRKTDDGEIVAFYKDGTTVGSIGTSASYLYIGNGDTGLLFNGGGDTISPRNPSTGAGRDAAIDLGVSSERFKDLYLSGGLRGDTLTFSTLAGTERMRIDSSGNLLVGKTAESGSTAGHFFSSTGYQRSTRNGGIQILNRITTDGSMIDFQKDGSAVGSIGFVSTGFYIQGETAHSGFRFGGNQIVPFRDGADTDNTTDLGGTSVRFDDIYATNGTIQTSDINEKQQIASLTTAELTAAKTISGLFKTFKWNDSVAEKGDDARTHSGVIAQEVEQALTDAGLDAGDYAFFISSTWWEAQTEVPAVEAVAAQDAVYEDVIIPAVEEVLDEEGNVVTEAQPERTEQRLISEAVEAVEAQEAYTRTDTYDTLEEAPEGATERNRKGIRYPELLSFIGAATEQRLASIEARLDALEGV